MNLSNSLQYLYEIFQGLRINFTQTRYQVDRYLTVKPYELEQFTINQQFKYQLALIFMHLISCLQQMDKTKIKIIVILILSIAIQAINLAGSGYLKTVYSLLDELHPPTKGEPSHMDENQGNSNYVFASSSLSVVIYIYLLVVKIKGSSIHKVVDWFAYVVVNCFQFGIAVTYSIFVTNNLVRFQTALMNYYGLLTIIPNIPDGTLVPDPSPYAHVFSLQSLCTAAAVLTFLICVIGGFYAFYKETNAQHIPIERYKQKKKQAAVQQKSTISEIVSMQ